MQTSFNSLSGMKRILLLADINSSHIHKWAGGLSEAGFKIGVFSITRDMTGWLKKFPSIQLYCKKNIKPGVFHASEFMKIQFITLLPEVKRAIKDFKPDIVHAHYATSYGLLGALSGFKPLFISLWGSDVYQFPEKSLFHAALLRFNLSRAERIFSIGYIMAEQIRKYTKGEVEVIHWGIDPDIFRPMSVQGLFEKNCIVIGTVKKLEKIYGIDFLIKAFGIIKQKLPSTKLKLLLVGDGTQRNNLENLVAELGLKQDVVFTGAIPNEKVSVYHNMFNIAVYLSNAESFGVSVIESSACGKPVVVSRVGGLPEVVEDGITGIIVPSQDSGAAAVAIIKLISDEAYAKKLGENGRQRVLRLYDWSKSLEKMAKAYQETNVD